MRGVSAAWIFASRGNMSDIDRYREYLFARLSEVSGTTVAIGAAAPNWKASLEALTRLSPPFGINPQAGVPTSLDAPHHGITVMIDAGGNARGRIWLPTNTFTLDGNNNRWFTHEFQVIADGPAPGTMVWEWQDKGGADVRPFHGAVVPPVVVEPTPPTPPVDTDYEERITALEGRVKALTAQGLIDIARIDELEQKVSLAAKRGDPVQVIGSISLTEVVRGAKVKWDGNIQ